MKTKYTCKKCGEIAPGHNWNAMKATQSNMSIEDDGIHFDFRHFLCGGKVTITDDGVARKEIITEKVFI